MEFLASVSSLNEWFGFVDVDGSRDGIAQCNKPGEHEDEGL
jgi:hypothetical protein